MKKPKMLFVDDSSSPSKELREIFDIDCTWNGAEAIEKARQKKYDIIVMDYNMPVMNGYESAKRIREFDKDCYIAGYSSSWPKDKAKECNLNIVTFDLEWIVEDFKSIKR